MSISSAISGSSIAVPVTSKADAKAARGTLYKYVFKHWTAVISIIPALFNGALPLLIFLFFGRIINSLGAYYASLAAGDPHDPMGDVWRSCVDMIIIAAVSGVTKLLETLLWIRNGAFLSAELRRDLFSNLMKSEVSFFDVNPIGDIMTLLSEDAQQVEDAFGLTKGTQIENLGQFVVGIVLAFVYCWQMALIALCSIPLMAIALGLFMPGMIKATERKFIYLSNGMTIAEETLANQRTVKGCNREDFETKRFMHEILGVGKMETRVGSFSLGVICIVTTILWGVVIGNLYYGSTLVDKGKLEVGNLFSVFGYSIFSVMGIMQLQATLQGEQKAISAGSRILKLIEHVPAIPFDGGKTIDNFTGHIEFRNVSFKYPTRDVYVLKNVSFEVKPCQMGALCGHSGSGKSTSVQLLERFYDAEEGLVLLDGEDIRTLDPRWLHRRIGLVGQEPLLFQMTVKENILYGAPEGIGDEEVFAAAEVANAMKFIQKMDHGFDQNVGERGSALSGGQRQRVAIARAVVKDPVILITDEATAALDAESEKKVQRALDKVMESRTALVVAHRLSTIRNADIIYVFDAGEIKEVGTHASLVPLGGYYYNLVKRQLMQEDGKAKNKKVEQADAADQAEASRKSGASLTSGDSSSSD